MPLKKTMDESYDQYEKVDLYNDEVEGTKDFGKAYHKLIKKFYHEEGANLMIPEEDMVAH